MKKKERDRDGDWERVYTVGLKAMFLVSFLPLLAGRSSYAEEALWDISLRPAEVFQGGVVEIRVSGPNIAGMKMLLRDREIVFFQDEASFFALLGMDLDEKPGTLNLTLKGRSKTGEKRDKLVTVRVREKAFPKESFKVPPSFDRIDEATRRRIEREQAELGRLWAISSPRRLWEGGFITPVPGGVTSPFGLRRIISGAARAPHSGVDLKAPLGAEVVAPNHGQVVLRDDFFFSGKSLVLDHGGGLYTMYFHLSDFNVEKNGWVRRGDVIGWAGMTGRVTGPHLHWGARLNGARVDPFELIEATGERH